MRDVQSTFDGIWQLMVASLVVPVVLTILIIAVIVWAIRRNAPPREDPAVAALKERFARGEIDQAEFEVRLRSLTMDRD